MYFSKNVFFNKCLIEKMYFLKVFFSSIFFKVYVSKVQKAALFLKRKYHKL